MERKDGSITFLKRDSEATLKELKFTEAYLVEHREHFDASGEKPSQNPSLFLQGNQKWLQLPTKMSGCKTYGNWVVLQSAAQFL